MTSDRERALQLLILRHYYISSCRNSHREVCNNKVIFICIGEHLILRKLARQSGFLISVSLNNEFVIFSFLGKDTQNLLL